MFAPLQKRHSWVFSMLEANPEGGSEYDVAEALPDFSAAAHRKSVMDVKQWLKTLPLSRRQLCKVLVMPSLRAYRITSIHSHAVMALTSVHPSRVAGISMPTSTSAPGCMLHAEAVVHALQSSSVVAPEEAIKTVQMILTPSQGRPLPPVHLENVSTGLLLLPAHVRLALLCSRIQLLHIAPG